MGLPCPNTSTTDVSPVTPKLCYCGTSILGPKTGGMQSTSNTCTETRCTQDELPPLRYQVLPLPLLLRQQPAAVRALIRARCQQQNKQWRTLLGPSLIAFVTETITHIAPWSPMPAIGLSTYESSASPTAKASLAPSQMPWPVSVSPARAHWNRMLANVQ